MSKASTERPVLDDPLWRSARRAAALFVAAEEDIYEFCRRAREKQRASGHTVVTGASGPR